MLIITGDLLIHRLTISLSRISILHIIIGLLSVMTLLCAAEFRAFSKGNSNSRPGQSLRDVSVKDQVETLIAPYKFKMRFDDNWTFGDIDTATDSDIVFYLKDKNSRRLFIWLTPKNDKVWRQAQSNSFNMIAAGENSDRLTLKQKETAEKIFKLIINNDKSGVSLQKKISLKTGNRTLQLSANKEKKDEETAHSINKRIFLLLGILLAATILFKIIAGKIKRVKA